MRNGRPPTPSPLESVLSSLFRLPSGITSSSEFSSTSIQSQHQIFSPLQISAPQKSSACIFNNGPGESLVSVSVLSLEGGVHPDSRVPSSSNSLRECRQTVTCLALPPGLQLSAKSMAPLSSISRVIGGPTCNPTDSRGLIPKSMPWARPVPLTVSASVTDKVTQSCVLLVSLTAASSKGAAHPLTLLCLSGSLAQSESGLPLTLWQDNALCRLCNHGRSPALLSTTDLLSPDMCDEPRVGTPRHIGASRWALICSTQVRAAGHSAPWAAVSTVACPLGHQSNGV